jgi:aldehyde dehydrogenase (NAD+)
MNQAFPLTVTELLVELGVPVDGGESQAELQQIPLLPGAAFGSRFEMCRGTVIEVRSPIDHSRLGNVAAAAASDVPIAIERAQAAYKAWRIVPAPKRGELVYEIGQQLRRHKSALAKLVTLENGKIFQEALGEVQEMIDICDFAVGLSRQLYGLTIASERTGHRLAEQWLPLGPIGVISAFNFPVAVWAWNAMIALVCGDPVVWKPSEKTPITALACHAIALEAINKLNFVPTDVLQLVTGGADIGHEIANAGGLPLISATGSTRMGKLVAATVGSRLGRTILELGGNNAAIVTPSADLELAIRAILFSAVGTCGQRCTTLRRLIIHNSRYAEVRDRLYQVYQQIAIGDPRVESTLVGPLVDAQAFEMMQAALARAKEQGGLVSGGQRVTQGVPAKGFYVQPALVEIGPDAPVVQHETFAPILYLHSYETIEEAIHFQNSVSQGLSSSIFTLNVREAEWFCSAAGSDCGIANVNIGTSGAEIGGAFGGEKDTGGGRESGSDSWKAYMRRATNTINYSTSLPLAQGIKFDLE